MRGWIILSAIFYDLSLGTMCLVGGLHTASTPDQDLKASLIPKRSLHKAHIPVVLEIPVKFLLAVQFLEACSVPEEQGKVSGQNAVLDVSQNLQWWTLCNLH